MPINNEYKAQKNFVKDGDDNYVPRRPTYRPPAGQARPKKQPYTKCECGGKMKPRGSIGTCGQASSKCTKCGKRVYTQQYKGRDGLAVCY